MILDLKSVCTVNRMKLLLWNGDARYHRYWIAASVDGTTWTTIVDRTTGEYQGWQDLMLDPAVTARYFKLVGTYNSVGNGFRVVEWEVDGRTP